MPIGASSVSDLNRPTCFGWSGPQRRRLRNDPEHDTYAIRACLRTRMTPPRAQVPVKLRTRIVCHNCDDRVSFPVSILSFFALAPVLYSAFV